MSLVLAFLFNAFLAVAQTSTVTCTAKYSYHCANSEGGCEPDRIYSITFTVDRISGTVVDSDGQTYRILPIPSREISGTECEYAIQATAQVGICSGLQRPSK